MKKIVSVLAVAALSLSVVFAAEVSLSYKTAGTLYSEKNEKNIADDTGAKQTRTALDQSGYKDAQTDIVISAKADWAGFVLDFDPNASTKADMQGTTSKWFDQYYAWLNFGPLQVTTGKWESRYTNELDDDKGAWANTDFNRYHLGVINGKFAHDIDNLTAVATDKKEGWTFGTKIAEKETEQKVSTAVAYTVRPNDGTYFMIKGVAVQNPWGSTLRMGGDERTYDDFSKDTGGDLYFNSGFAAEVAYHVENSFDFNFVAKSLKRDELALGAFVRPTLGKTNLLVGVSFGKDLSEKKSGDDKLRTYYEGAVDFRLRKPLNDKLTLTTMHNISVYNPEEKVKDQKYNEMASKMWNMVSFGYKANEQLLLQLTAQNECVLFNDEQDKEDADKTKMWGPRTNGGYDLSIMPAVVYSFNENASLSAGLKWTVYNVGALDVWKADKGVKTASEFQIPVVFKVSL